MNTYSAKFSHFYYVVLNEQLLIILCDEVVPVVNPEEEQSLSIVKKGRRMTYLISFSSS